MRKLTLLLLALLVVHFSFSQGSIMLVGGGSEDIDQDNSWSDQAYQWIIDQSENKKIAIISAYEETDVLPNYFIKLGAIEAVNFEINSKNKADKETIYEEIMAFDAIFLKGGNQLNYYNFFKGTELERALQDKYWEGGVLSGTSAGAMILGEVIYIDSESIYPYEALDDVNHEYITLVNDFMNILPKMIVDTHFVERGRFPRLLSFMAHWDVNQEEGVTGLGIDDKTAIGIHKGVGTVFGSGGVTIFPKQKVGFFEVHENGSIQSENIKAISLVEGQSISFSDYSITSEFPVFNFDEGEESLTNNTILIGGDGPGRYQDLLDEIESNHFFLENFAQEGGKEMDIMIIYGKNDSIASAYSKALTEEGVNGVIQEVDIENFDISSYSAHSKFLITGVEIRDWISLNETFKEDLISFFKEDGKIIGFGGESGNLSGAYTFLNITDPDAAYEGRLEKVKGMGLVETAMIIPDTYGKKPSAPFAPFETKVSSLPLMLSDGVISKGFWLSPYNGLKIELRDGKRMIQAFGNRPVMMIELPQKGVYAGMNSSKYERETASISDFRINYLVYDKLYNLNNYLVEESTTLVKEYEELDLVLNANSRNIDKQYVYDIYQDEEKLKIINRGKEKLSIKLIHSSGKSVKEYSDVRNDLEILKNEFIEGIYLVVISTEFNDHRCVKMIIY